MLREVLVNAIAHRDYSPSAQGTQVQGELYPDRLLIRNPGGLFGPLDVSDLGLGTSPASSRNLVLLKILEDTPLEPGHTACENRGTGIAQVRASLTNAGMEPPTFEDNIATFVVTIPSHALLDEAAIEWLSSLDVRGLSRGQLTALVLAHRGETLTNTSYRRATGVADSRTASAHLRNLRDRGLLVQEGDRGQSIYRLARTGSSDPGETRTPTHSDIVLAALTGVPASRGEIAERTGLTETQVRGVLVRLRKAGLAELVGAPRSRNALWRRSEQPMRGESSV